MGLIRKFRLLSLVFLIFLLSFSLAFAANNAQFVGQTVPSRMIMGQSYTVSITMKNTGNTTWTRAGVYRLGSVNPYDNWNWGLGRVELSASDSIAPGQTKTFTFTVKPQKTGNLNFQWRMIGGQWFGGLSQNVVVSVEPSYSTCRYDESMMSKISKSMVRYSGGTSTGLLAATYTPFNKSGSTHLAYTTWTPLNLWKAYLFTQDAEVKTALQRHIDGVWRYMKAPNGLLYETAGVESGGHWGSSQFRADYSVFSMQHWNEYVTALNAGTQHQVRVNEETRRASIVYLVDPSNPDQVVDPKSPVFRGILLERILLHKYFQSETQAERNDALKRINYVINGWEHTEGNTGLYPANVKWSNGDVVSDSQDWNNIIADTVYAEIQLSYILGNASYRQLAKQQTDAAIKYAWKASGANSGYFAREVDVNTGRVTSSGPEYHTEWEWGIVLLQMWKAYNDNSYRDYADKLLNYLRETRGSQSAFELGRAVVFSTWFYEYTGDVKYRTYAREFLDETFSRFCRSDMILSGTRGNTISTMGDPWTNAVVIEAIMAYENGILYTDDFGFYPAAFNAVFPSYKNMEIASYRISNGTIIVRTVNSGVADVSVFTGTREPYEVFVNGVRSSYRMQPIGPGIFYTVVENISSPATILVRYYSCNKNPDCISKVCSYNVCCDSGQCGIAPSTCINNGGMAPDNNRICRSGQWKTLLDRWGCNTFPCDQGACMNSICILQNASGLANGQRCSNRSQCTSGFCSNTVCCNFGQCGWGSENGSPATCVDRGGTKQNKWASAVCRNGQWRTVLNGIGCNIFPCDRGVCVNRTCVAGLVCTPNSVSGCRVCNQNGTAWADDNSMCSSGQICQNGTCIANCSDECSTANQTQCSGNGFQTCGNHDSDSCLEWSAVTNCAANQNCTSGQCVNQTIPSLNLTCPQNCTINQSCTCTVSDCSEGLFVLRNTQGQPINMTLMIMSGDFPLTFFSSSPYTRSFTPTSNGTVSAVAVCLETGKIQAQSRQIEVT